MRKKSWPQNDTRTWLSAPPPPPHHSCCAASAAKAGAQSALGLRLTEKRGLKRLLGRPNQSTWKRTIGRPFATGHKSMIGARVAISGPGRVPSGLAKVPQSSSSSSSDRLSARPSAVPAALESSPVSWTAWPRCSRSRDFRETAFPPFGRETPNINIELGPGSRTHAHTHAAGPTEGGTEGLISAPSFER